VPDLPSLARRLAGAALLLVAAVLPRGARAQSGVAPLPDRGRASERMKAMAELPFGVGERLEYDAKYGPIKAGRGFMEVIAVEEVRGETALHLTMRVSGGALGWRVRYALDSWIAPVGFVSLRHTQDQNEGKNGARAKSYEIFPERGVYTQGDEPEKPTVAQPLDDASFLYFVRTVPLVVGETYEFNRYFRPDRNPVRVRVLRRERVKVPAGEFDAIVIQPVIKSKGLLGEGAHAEVWLTDDDRRLMLKMQANLGPASLSLHLKSVQGTREP
jgi:hypothetical protein